MFIGACIKELSKNMLCAKGQPDSTKSINGYIQ